MSDFAPPAGPPPPKVPEGWKAVWNPQYNEWFYVNIYTKQSQWDKPTEPVYPAGEGPPPGAPPGYTHSASGAVGGNPTGGSEKSGFGSNNPYANMTEDEKLARKLQEEENARSGGQTSDRGHANDYYNNPGQSQTPQYAGAGAGGGYGQSQGQPMHDDRSQDRGSGKKSGFLGKLIGKATGGSHSSQPSHGYPQQQHGYPPQQQGYGQPMGGGGYYGGGYPQRPMGGPMGGSMGGGYGGGYGGGMPMGGGRRPGGGGGGMGGMALGAGGGLLAGGLIGSAMADGGDEYTENNYYGDDAGDMGDDDMGDMGDD